MTGIRVDRDIEHDGIYVAVHGETAYVFDAPDPAGRNVTTVDAVTAAEGITHSAVAKDSATP